MVLMDKSRALLLVKGPCRRLQLMPLPGESLQNICMFILTEHLDPGDQQQNFDYHSDS
jgi:hypothetical protein